MLPGIGGFIRPAQQSLPPQLRSSATATPTSNSHAFTNMAFGPEVPGRILLVGVAALREAVARLELSSIIIGGSTAAILSQSTSTLEGTCAGWAMVVLPTGTSGNVVVNTIQSMSDVSITVYSFSGDYYFANAAAKTKTAVLTLTCSIDLEADYFGLLAVSSKNDTSLSVSGVDVVDYSTGSGKRHVFGSKIGSSAIASQDFTASHSTVLYLSMSAVSFTKVAPALSGSWSPAFLKTLRGWWKGDSLSGTTGDALPAWADASGWTNDASQSVSARRPTLVTSALNGMNAVSFNRANSQYFDLPSVPDFTEAALLAVIRNAQNLGVNNGSYFYSGQSQINHYRFGDNNIYDGNLSNTRLNLGNVALDLSAWHLVSINSQNFSRVFNQNGSQIANDANNLPQFDTMLLGSGGNTSYTYGGDIAEMFLTRNALSVPDFQKAEGYLAHKWALTAGLPAGHPYKTTPP
jgi:hypothetical protein